MAKISAKKNQKSKSGLISINKTVANNRRARFDYAIEEKFEAGIMLKGTEVKSLRHGQCSINESYVGAKNGEIWAFNINIPEYQQASQNLQHEPARPRKLLLHKREVNKLMGATQREGLTIIPLRLYFDKRGMVKIEIALAKGKKLHDKRETQKKRDWGKQKQRLLKSAKND
ncbi:MAG: SsrA-binding protein SmpB [Alphaproteobacteria bacterium]|nr:SsrA-binding protein SmpB [Alphaproteobacteria bacterium]